MGATTTTCEAPGCTYVARDACSLRQHARQHTGERPYACRAGCSAAFASRTAQLKHERVHAKPHSVCPEPGCGYLAANSSAMVRHTRKMGHAASVVCPFPNCAMRFKSYLALRMHKKRSPHAGEGGTSLCRTCGATFATVAEYVVHEKGHRVERLAKATQDRRKSAAVGGAEL